MGALVSACEKGEQWAQALLSLAAMDDFGLKADMIVMNAAISACEKAGQWSRGLALLEKLQEQSLQADDITYNALISAAEKAGHWPSAVQLLGEMRTAGWQPSVQSYNSAMQAFDKDRQLEEVLRLLDEMTAHGLVPDVQTYRLVLTECELKQVLSREVALLRSIGDIAGDPRSAAGRCLATAALNLAVGRLLAAGHVAEAEAVLVDAVLSGRADEASERFVPVAGWEAPAQQHECRINSVPSATQK